MDLTKPAAERNRKPTGSYDPDMQMYVEPLKNLDIKHLRSLRLAHMAGMFEGEWYSNRDSEIAKEKAVEDGDYQLA